MQNWSDAESAVESCSTATGELADAYETYLDSIEGRLGQLSAAWESFSTNFLDSSLVKGFISAITTLVNGIDSITQALNPLWSLIVPLAVYFAGKLFINKLLPSLWNMAAAWVTNRINLNKFSESLTEAERNAASMKNIMNGVLGITSAIAIVVSYTKQAGTTAGDVWTIVLTGIALVTLAIVALGAVVHKVINSNGILAMISLAITLVMALVEAIKGLANSSTRAKEKAVEAFEEITDSLEDTQSSIEDVESELSDLYDRLEELQELSENGTITLAEQDELNKLEAEIALLEAKKDALEAIAAQQEEQQAAAAQEAVDAILAEKMYGTTAGSLISTMLNNWDAATDELKTQVGDTLTELIDYLDVLDPESDQYKTIYKYIDMYNLLSNSLADLWDNLLSRSDYADAKEALLEFASAGDITSDSLKALCSSNSDVNDFINYLIELGVFAWDDAEKVEGLVNQIAAMVEVTEEASATLSGILNILDDINDEFDTLADALSDISEQGIISADTLETLLEEYSGLEKYFTKTAHGYTVADEYAGLSTYELLGEYINEYLEPYREAVAACEEGTYEWAVAQEALNDAIVVGATLLRTYQIEELEAMQDALEDQFDAYSDLVDIRKDLLESYQEEVDYQKELASKQKSVARLSTQLALAKLDTSAAGQARVRELESDLADAQEELDDYTLEHAIDVITAQLEDEEDEYEKFIKKQVQIIEDAISNIKVEVSVVTSSGDTETVGGNDSVMTEVTTGYQDVNSDDYIEASDSSTDTSTESNSNEVEAASNVGTPTQIDKKYAWYRYNSEDKSVGTGLDLGTKTVPLDDYKNNLMHGTDGNDYWHYSEWGEGAYAKKGEGYDIKKVLSDAYKIDIHSYKPLYKFHEGGLVDDTNLRSSEVFAKLLKGEFVSTPAQMDKFINDTLPSIASYGGGDVIYNSPLISIDCGTVTQDALPGLKDIVDEAVDKIQKQIDSGLSRNGYKRTVNKFSV